jgi:hypothetical protein
MFSRIFTCEMRLHVCAFLGEIVGKDTVWYQKSHHIISEKYGETFDNFTFL